MPTRDLNKIQAALNSLTDVHGSLNELKYYKTNLSSPNHSNALCSSVSSEISTLVAQHSELVKALFYYGNTYAGLDESLASSNNSDYQLDDQNNDFYYNDAPEHKKGYWERTRNQIIMGDFTDDVTVVGSLVSIFLSFTGADFVFDGRDFAADVQKGDGWGMFLNGISFAPIVGSFGEIGGIIKKTSKAADIIDEGGTILKQGEKISDTISTGKDIVKDTEKITDAIDDSKTISKNLNLLDLTDAQRKRIKTIDNIIENHMKDTDFSGTLRDLLNNPVPNGAGGFFDHKTEMENAYKGLKKAKEALEKSLNNPNLSEAAAEAIREAIQRAEEYIRKIEDLFRPFGGIK